MNLTIEKIPDSNFKLIPVASELVPSGIETITYKEEIFKIVDQYTFHKKEFFPTGFMNFVFGAKIDENQIWNKYKKSDRLIIFICEPIEAIPEKEIKKVSEEKQPEVLETEVPSLFSK